MSNQIIGNTEYKSIKEKAYINGTQENIMQLAAELDKAGINYSGRVSDYRSAITVEASDRVRTLEIMKGILNAAKETTPTANAEKNIIGNVEYRFISNKRYVKGETEAMLRTADRLTAENISFSGRINGDTVTLTVSGDEAQELVIKYFSEEKNRIENIQSAYFLALASDTFEDGYYISEVNVNTGEEIAQHRSQFGNISMFISVDSAVRYAEGAGVTLSNTEKQLNEWRRIEIEAEAEKDRQLNLSRSREIIKRLPMTSENDYEEHFVLRENAIDWIYYNSDGANGEGQFVQTTLYADDLIAAYNARSSTEDYRKDGQSEFVEIIQNGKQTVINADTEEFERLADIFIKSRSNENVIVSAPIVSGNGYDNNFERIINLLENHFEDVRNYKENHITEASENISVDGHIGTWYVIDSEEIEGRKLFLLEHEEYGDEAASIIIDENKNLVMEGVYNGFDDYRDSLEYDDDKQFVSRDLAVELWENGFTVFMNNRNNALPDYRDDLSIFELFTEEKNNTFYAFSKDIVQQRLLDDTVTLLDDLDSAARLESAEQGKEVGNVTDYAKDMYDDGDCAYKWSDGLTEWQNISASILSGNTEYIYAWLRDLQSELPYLKDNRNFSITAALDHLDNYEKEYMGKLSIDELKKGTRLVYNNTNWEVTHVNNNVLALKNLDSDNQMSSIIIERWQNVVTRSKVEFIAEKEINNAIEMKILSTDNEALQSFLDEHYPNGNLPFALANEICRYLDEKITFEDDGAYDKISYELTAYSLDDGKDYKYSNRFDIGIDNDKVQSLIENIADHNKYILEKTPTSMNIAESKRVLDVLVPFLNNHRELSDEELKILDEFKKQNPIQSLSDKLYEVAKRELANYEYSLDTAEKAKAAAYELSVKRDVLSYIEHDLPSDITDSDVENACRRLISTGYPLDSIYRDWLKNEYDNRMEAIRMTAEDTFRKENIKEYDIDKELRIGKNPIVFSVVSINGGNDIVVGEYIDGDNVRYMEEYLTAVSETNSDTLDVQVHFYTVGNMDNDNESIEADEAQIKYISEHLNEVLSQATLLESELYSVKITDKEIENSDRIIPEKSLEFTVITFEDDSVYVEAGRIDDDNVNGTAAYADMMKNNFDVDKMEDLDESIKVEYAVYHTGDGEAVIPTEKELAEIRNNLDDYIGEKDPVSAEDSYLHPWKNVDDILFDLEKLWTERHNTAPQISDDSGSFYHLLPENLNHTGQSGDVRYYDTYSSVQLIKLKDSEWLHPVDAAVELNRRGFDLNDVEMLNVNMIDEYGHFHQRDITPEQFAVYEKRIEGDLKGYNNILGKYRQERERIEKARETAHNAGVPFRETYADESEEDFNPYAFDGTMSPEDYELMHKLMREDSFEIYQVKSGDKYFFKRFVDLSTLGGSPDMSDYDLVYSGKLSEQDITDQSRDEILESVYVKFNNDRPEDFMGRSLSVSDIVVLHKNGEDTAHYVDGVGFKDVPEFFITLEERFARETLTNNLALIAKNQLASDELDELAENLFNFKNNNIVPLGNWVMGRDLDAITFGGLMAAYNDGKDIRAELAKHIYSNYEELGYIETFERGKPDFSVTSSRDDNGMTFSTNGGFSVSYTWEELGEALINVASAEYDRHNNIEKEYEKFLAENKEFFTLFDNRKDIPVIIKNSAEFDYYRTAEHGYTNLRLHFKEHEGYLLQADNAENECITIHNYTLVNGETVLGMMNGVNLTYNREAILHMIEEENISQDISESEKNNADISANSPVGKPMLKEGDLITLADRHGVWKVSAVTDIQIEFENTDPNSPEKSFSHIDFGQRREHLQETLQYTLVSEREESRTDKAANSPVGTNEALEKAKQLISDFCDREYGSTGDFSDLHNVSIAYTTLTDDELPIQVTADLIDFKLIFELNGQKYNEEQYNSLEELIEYELSNLDFDELVYVPDRVLEKYISGGEPTDLMSEFSEAIEEKTLKTVTNQYNSFLLVQDVVYSLRDLQDGYADNYDWKNYAEAFNKVLDSNVNTDVALPLYKSGADDILLAAAEKKVISADDIAKALSNLELVLQNSHLLKNPEEKIEQMSFFSNTPNRTSSDEIGYSSASEPPQSEKEKSPVGNNPQEEKAEKKTAVDYTITDKNYGTEGGAKTRFANNVAAIKLLKAIEKENRTATPEEQEVLAKYVGWGGIANAFDSRKPDWNKEYNELKSLLTDEEYRAARASTMNAHYTSPVVINAIYSGLENLGFKGGKILEPAMGIGNFFGAMPDSIRNNSNLHGVELDSITGRIAQQLYPSANIQVKGYEDTGFENGSFDVAIGNVPFGGYKVNDKDYNKQNFLIHDYFFAKTLDKVRAGGIVAFVTSKGTLDKESPEVRKYLAERAELLGAIRLPNNAFKENAGTEVTSDIIFLQKRERPISIEGNPPEWVYKDILPNGIAVNKYFADHPEMILGEMVEGNKLYGNQTDASMCVPIEGADLEEQLAAAIKNITGEYKAAKKGIEENSPVETDEIPCPPNAPKFSFIVQDDVLYYHKSSDTMEKYKAPDKCIEKIKAMAQLRDSVHKLLDLQLDNTNGRFDTAISEAQAALNRLYDDFSEKYGLISNSENKMLFRNDNSYHLIKSLEKLDKDGNFIGKADIFSKITVNPKIVVDYCDNAQDALILSLAEKMCVNLEYMSILTGKSEEELIAELGDKIYQNPQKFMRWESADEYLTGNIRSKLAAAEAAGLTRNAEALRAVMPERIEAADISVKLGSAWIDPDYIRQFIVETLKPDYITSKNIEVTYMPATDRWKVDGYKSAYENTLANETYGTYDMNAYEIIEATLNMQKAEIKQRVKDEHGNDVRDSKGRYVYEVNQKKTMIAQSKQDELKRMFSDWIFSDPDRREKLVDVYNEKFNSVRLREYDGSHLNFVGMSSAITLKDHQKNAVARGLYSNGNTLLAHEVGAGKTYEMITIAMEGKRLGLHNKSLITAPNGLTEQWGNAFRTLYPNANVLVATEKDFQKENRRDLFAKIATGDWDAVVIGHSQFDMIHLSRERELDVLHSELDILEEALREIDDGGKKNFSVKQIEKSIRMYEDKIEKLLAKAPEDDMLCFEKLGIDKIFVDESQAYKNLDTPTKMRNVSGIGSGGSGRSMQLLMKCKYLDEVTGGKGTVFASGTPISNSMSEMYTLMRYLQADKLAELGINSFDRWASVFGETVSSMELSPEGNGKYQLKTRFAKFQNLPELMNIFKECADIKTAESLDLDRPDFEMHNVNVPATAVQAMMIKELGERAKEIRAGHVDPTDDNMCKLTVDGRKIGLDQRCMNPNLPDDPKSKVNVCINNVFDIWQRTAEEKSTQLIFCDLATPQPTLNENTYTVYRKNAKGGYSDVYSAKLGEKDTAEKIMKKLNGKKPPKNYEAGDISNGDIIMLKRVNYEEETAYNAAFEMVDGKLTEIAPETWEKLHHTPVEQFESERRFCVYDDIKQKLIEKGVPEKEIAFIHDVDKAEEKQKLYDKMNKGEIRVLIGSTFKCGAGMNAQERMIALHDLDAPMRPSDMEQRHGRIIRQGNTNNKVDIYRYTTDKTFDAYLYQMLENKQRFISQIMTDKSPVRSCEDVDEVALDYAEVKALCAGNPLIREKIDLETDITKLNVLKSAFLSQKYSLQDKAYKSLPEHRKHTERYIGQLKADIETVQSVKPLVNEDDKKYYPVTVGGREYHDKEKAGQAIRNAIIGSSELTEKKQCHIGSYRGFEMTAFLDTKWEGHTVMKINLKGACDHSCEINMNNDVKASGNIIRLDNVINGMELELQKQEDRLQSLNADIEEAKIAAEAPFPQEQELTEKEKRLAEVNTLLSDTEVQVDNSMELYAALVEICPELETYSNFDCKYEKGKDSGIEPLIVKRFEDTVLIAHTYIKDGDTMYDPAIEFSFDTQNHRAQALTYELSGLGIYQDFRDGNRPEQKADVEEMALGVMFENIKAYGYERTKFNVNDDREEAEKEIRDGSAR